MSASPSAGGSAQGSGELLILDWGARIGAAAHRDRIERTQLMNLIASLDAVQGREALLLAAAFALRQAKRLDKGHKMARLVNRALLDLYEKGYGKEEARKMLGFAKWVYEAEPDFRGEPEQLTLKSLLKQLAGVR